MRGSAFNTFMWFVPDFLEIFVDCSPHYGDLKCGIKNIGHQARLRDIAFSSYSFELKLELELELYYN